MHTPLRKDDIQGQIIHVYDGIEEADNELPRWWLATFFGAIVFGACYWLVHESFAIVDYPGVSYTKARLAAMETGGPVTDEDLLSMVADAPMVAAGKATFMRECSKCHGTKAQGKEGPNLTDAFWLHGGAPSDIFNTVANGAPKGMPAWGPRLGRGAVKQTTAYLLSLRNTDVKGKEPQGERWVEPPKAPPAEASAEAPAEAPLP